MGRARRAVLPAVAGASRITWALMPPKPNALTAARRGGVPSHGSAAATRRGSASRERGVRLLAVQRRRQHAVMHRERGLDQAGDAGGRHRVADHRLHRAERTRARPSAAAEDARERLELGRVAGRRRGAVRLDEADGGRGRAPRRARRASSARTWPSTPASSGSRRGRRSPRRCRGSPRRCDRRRARRRRAA